MRINSYQSRVVIITQFSMQEEPTPAELRQHLDTEKLKEVISDLRRKKRELKKQVVKLTWISRGSLANETLDSMLDQPVDFGYKKAGQHHEYHHPRPKVGSRTQEFLASWTAEVMKKNMVPADKEDDVPPVIVGDQDPDTEEDDPMQQMIDARKALFST
jgi:hypothetical protein